MPFPRAEDSDHESKALQRRHRFYLQLLLICLLLLGTFTLTLSLKLLITVGYTAMVLLLVLQLGRPVAALFRNRFRNLGYRALGESRGVARIRSPAGDVTRRSRPATTEDR